MNYTIKNTIIVVLILITTQSFGQQDPVYTQYYNNFSLINPAYAGSHGLFTGTANIRSQWSGIPGGPETQTLSVHGPSGKNVGLGFSVVRDNIFVLNETHVFADFSYRIELNENSTLGFGLKAGGRFLDVDLISLGITDDLLFSENINTFNPNLGVGAYYFTDRFYASLSTINLLKTKHYKKSSNVVASASDEMIFYLSAGYVFDLKGDFKLKPSGLIRSVNNSPLSTDVSLSLLWANKLEFGLSHRFEESISVLCQVRVTGNLKIAYTYEGFTGNIGNYNNGSHEISFVMNLSKKSNNLRKSPFYWMGNEPPVKREEKDIPE